jgi:putative flippase GtrA
VKFFRYFVVGGVAAAVDIGCFFVLAKLAGFPYLVVAPFGFMLATWVNYELSVRHVFRSGARFSRKREVMLVYVVSGVGLLINQAALYVLVGRLGVELVLAKCMATATVFVWNYCARNMYVFR